MGQSHGKFRVQHGNTATSNGVNDTIRAKTIVSTDKHPDANVGDVMNGTAHLMDDIPPITEPEPKAETGVSPKKQELSKKPKKRASWLAKKKRSSTKTTKQEPSAIDINNNPELPIDGAETSPECRVKDQDEVASDATKSSSTKSKVETLIKRVSSLSHKSHRRSEKKHASPEPNPKETCESEEQINQPDSCKMKVTADDTLPMQLEEAIKLAKEKEDQVEQPLTEVEQVLHKSPSPEVSKQEPEPTKEEPELTKEEPEPSKEEPVSLKEEPVSLKEEAGSLKEEEKSDKVEETKEDNEPKYQVVLGEEKEMADKEEALQSLSEREVVNPLESEIVEEQKPISPIAPAHDEQEPDFLSQSQSEDISASETAKVPKDSVIEVLVAEEQEKSACQSPKTPDVLEVEPGHSDCSSKSEVMNIVANQMVNDTLEKALEEMPEVALNGDKTAVDNLLSEDLSKLNVADSA